MQHIEWLNSIPSYLILVAAYMHPYIITEYIATESNRYERHERHAYHHSGLRSTRLITNHNCICLQRLAPIHWGCVGHESQTTYVVPWMGGWGRLETRRMKSCAMTTFQSKQSGLPQRTAAVTSARITPSRALIYESLRGAVIIHLPEYLGR